MTTPSGHTSAIRGKKEIGTTNKDRAGQTIGEVEDVGLDKIIAQTLAVNAGSRAVRERVGLSYVRGFSSSMTAQVEGLEAGEVEYEMTREQLRRRRS